MAETSSSSERPGFEADARVPIQQDALMGDFPTEYVHEETSPHCSDKYSQTCSNFYQEQEVSAYPIRPTAGVQNHQTRTNPFKPFPSHQALFDFIGLPDHYTDPSLADRPPVEFEDHLTGVSGMSEASLPSTLREMDCVDAHSAFGVTSHQEPAESTSSRFAQQSNSDQLDSMMRYEPLHFHIAST